MILPVASSAKAPLIGHSLALGQRVPKKRVTGLSGKARDALEIARMTPRQIDDAVAHLLLHGARSISVQDVLDVGALPEDSGSADA
jgi:hypothetical protein